MHWEERLLALFDDLEQQAEGLALAARDAEVAELGRAEYAHVDLTSRVHGSVRGRLALAVDGVGRMDVELVRAGADWCLVRDALHEWLVRYELGGLEGLVDRSHRPGSCPHQMPAAVEVAVLEARRKHPGWGARRIVHELGRAGVVPVPSQSGVYRALRRAAPRADSTARPTPDSSSLACR